MSLKKVLVQLMVFVFLVTTLMFTSLTVVAAATTYYVSQSAGNDNNNGTSTSTPWKTLAKVGSRTYGAGDQILLNCGDSWNETLTISNSSGASGSPITLSSYGSGNRPYLTRNTANTDICVMINDASYWNISNLEVSHAV